MHKVSIIDYGMSNLLSIARAFEKVGAEVSVISSFKEINKSSKLVLPGVGAFPDGMKELGERNLIEAIKEYVDRDKPFLGICLGMQMMLSKGYEMSETEGLNLIKGEVKPLPLKTQDGKLNKVPHMGWNSVLKPEKCTWLNTIFESNSHEDYMYFVHSFYAQLENSENELAYTSFGDAKFTSAIYRKKCFGTQFHPEKSGEIGLKLLKKFLEI